MDFNELIKLNKKLRKLGQIRHPDSNVIDMMAHRPLKLIFCDKWPQGALYTKEAWRKQSRPSGAVSVFDVDPGLAGALSEHFGIVGPLTTDDLD